MMISSLTMSGQTEASFLNKVVCADVANRVGSERAQRLHNLFSYFLHRDLLFHLSSTYCMPDIGMVSNSKIPKHNNTGCAWEPHGTQSRNGRWEECVSQDEATIIHAHIGGCSLSTHYVCVLGPQHLLYQMRRLSSQRPRCPEERDTKPVT